MACSGQAPDDLKAKALAIHRRLCREYGCPIAYFHDHDPLSELVSALLSHRTRNADSGRAFTALRSRYPTWEALRDAPTAEVETLIRGVTWPEQKAPRIQATLRGDHGSAWHPDPRFPRRDACPRGARLAGGHPGRRPQDQRGRPVLQQFASRRIAGRQSPSPGGAAHGTDPAHHGRGSVPCRSGRAAAT
ncbi:Endonuclease III [Rubellimicrobium mesophilum DSM 19309]|uniref:Endonuclease III n=1 Tax=Rubellimicrobium mesophilum DSM 19309 TaxID=442562 RepID=A0A017HSD5_9RHOB|nr:Endonuclease III [Rubellimicrobium mesophilum DSM 19309]